MAFLESNAVVRGEETVDTKFSPIVEANLWADSTFEAGRTFTDKYQTDAMGQLFVRRLGKGSVDRSGSLTFTHDQTADELIPIVIDEDFKQSEAIYEEVEIARTSGTGAQKFETLVRNVNESWQQEALDKLVDGATASSNTTATAADTIKEDIINVRRELRENKANPTALIVSPRVFAYMQEYSGREYQPSFNDEVLRTGQMGQFLGLPVYENTLMTDDGSAGAVEFIMYDHEAYSILTQRIAQRIVDAGKDWAGSAAQFHIKSGFKVTTPERVIKKTVS